MLRSVVADNVSLGVGSIMELVFTSRDIIAGKQLREFTRRNDWVALVWLTGHVGAIGITGYLVYLTLGTLWVAPAIFIHGLFVTFLYSPMHECSHGTAFRSRWINETVSWFVCLLYVSTPTWYRFKHAAHHAHTQIRGKDPDMVLPFPRTFGQYVWYCTGLPMWHRFIGSLVRHASGRISPKDYGWLPLVKRPRVILESRITLAVYASVGVAAVAFGSSAPLIYWLIPRLVSEPLLRWLRVTEHVGCAEGSDIRTNTRTTKANPLLRFFFWNMPYHAVHHLCPSVPFHRLPALHRAVGDQLHEVGQGYIAVHRDILRNHLTGK